MAVSLLGCVLKLSFRNLFRNKGKTFVIGAILFVGGVVCLLGGATLNVVERNLKNSLVHDFLGHVTVMPKSQTNEKVFDQFVGSPLRVFEDAEPILALLEAESSVAKTLPYGLGFLSLLSSQNNPIGYPPGCSVIGVDLAAYESFYDNLEFLEGGLSAEKPLERGLLLSAAMRNMYFKFSGVLYLPKEAAEAAAPKTSEHWPAIAKQQDVALLNKETDLVLLGVSTKKTVRDIRAEVLGVFRYKRFHNLWGELSLLDMGSFREAMDLQGSEEVALSAEEARGLALAEDESGLLGLFGEGYSAVEEVPKNLDVNLKKGSLRSAPEERLEGSEGVEDAGGGGYQLIAIKLREGVEIDPAVERLNGLFSTKNLDAKAVPWTTAGGAVVSFVGAIRVVLTLVLGVIFAVAIVVIMNTLAMATLERSSELGMMRAMGAAKILLGWMLLGETFVLAFFFGSLGMLAGASIALALNRIGVPVENEFLQIFVGGEAFRPALTPKDIALGNLWLFGVTCLSVLYPLWVGRRILPLDAAVRD